MIEFLCLVTWHLASVRFGTEGERRFLSPLPDATGLRRNGCFVFCFHGPAESEDKVGRFTGL
jgi:hypothetical protein